MRHLAPAVAIVLVAGLWNVSGYLSAVAPLDGGVGTAAAAEPAVHESSDYFPAAFRDVRAWDLRPQPEAF